MGTGAHPRGTNLLPQVSLLSSFCFPKPAVLFFFLSFPYFLLISLPAHFYLLFESTESYRFFNIFLTCPQNLTSYLSTEPLFMNVLKVSSINASFTFADPLTALYEAEDTGRECREQTTSI